MDDLASRVAMAFGCGIFVILAVIVLLFLPVTDVLHTVQKKKGETDRVRMRDIALAWEAYERAHGNFCPPGSPGEIFSWGNVSYRELASILSPKFMLKLPEIDASGYPYEFAVACSGKSSGGYGIRSRGADGQWEGYSYLPGTRTRHPSCDIVFINGDFIQWPLEWTGMSEKKVVGRSKGGGSGKNKNKGS